MSNRLQNQESPYLLQHKDNPVDWYPWCQEAFQTAAEKDKPIFLSIGYSTCHWCHVMAHESFENNEAAEILNRFFVCIKVDREERPDIDSIYMSVCQALTGSGGWPLTIIMTPKQKPFFAGTYFPLKSRYGQAGLIDILKQTANMWRTDRKKLLTASDRITEVINQSIYQEERTPDKSILQNAYEIFKRRFDPDWGGFGSAPKFPSPHNLLFLIRYSQLKKDSFAMKMAKTTLYSMERGGIHDQIGGGFSRYSTDEIWLIPHFEKMLYDNALAALAYTQAYYATKEKIFEQTAKKTLDYMLRDLYDNQGGFLCAQDADSNGEEGLYYLFTQNEVEQVLGIQDGREFCELYGINGNFGDKSVPNRIGQTSEGWDKSDIRLKKLYDYRLKRASLHIDDKILLSWNSWAIIAFAKAAAAFDNSLYMETAVKAQMFIENNMTDADKRLYLRWRNGKTAHKGQLDDYAVYSLALITLYETTFKPEYLYKAILYAEMMIEFFEDKNNGGFFLTASDAEELISRPKETYDGAIPSGNSSALTTLQKLSFLTGEIKWKDASERQMRFMASAAAENPSGHSFALLAMNYSMYEQKELICVSDKITDDEMKILAVKSLQDDLHILVKTRSDTEILEKCAPLLKNYNIPSKGTVYYLCENGTCRSPETDINKVLN